MTLQVLGRHFLLVLEALCKYDIYLMFRCKEGPSRREAVNAAVSKEPEADSQHLHWVEVPVKDHVTSPYGAHLPPRFVCHQYLGGAKEAR